MTKQKKEFKAVIFDLDGTLVDSGDTIAELFQTLISEAGFRRPSKGEVRAVEARGRSATIEVLLPPERRGDEELKKRLGERCREISFVLLPKIKCMNGAKETLEWLRKRKVKTAIATNRGAPTTLRLLGLLGMDMLFDAIVASEHVKNCKPHPEPVLTALKLVGVRADEAIFVGDSEIDLQAGKAAGIKTILLNKEIQKLDELKRWF